MTTIVWDGKVLAGDRKSTWGGTPIPYRKVFKVMAPNGRYALVGYSGSGAFAQAHLHWLRGGEKPEIGKTEWAVLMIEDTGRIWYRSDTADCWDHVGARRWSIGSGADYALGAMAMGASAREAVLVASKLDNQTGLGVNVVRFR